MEVGDQLVGGVRLKETLNHCDGSDDSPAWTQTKTRPDAASAWDTTWERYLTDLSSGLGLSVDSAGVVRVQFANPHGDIVATATLGQTGLDSYTETDEYGQPADPAADQPRYGWLGTHQRDTGNTIAGLTLMGARLYEPVIGRFLSIDPVPGGNDNRYTYPGDPVNELDLDGQCRSASRCRADGSGGGVGGRGPAFAGGGADRPGVVTRVVSRVVRLFEKGFGTVRTKFWIRRYPSGGGGAGVNRDGKNIFRIGKSNWKDSSGAWVKGMKKYSVHYRKNGVGIGKHRPWGK